MKDTKRHWQNLAQQTRALAGRMTDPETKRVLLEIAVNYDRLAELALVGDRAG
jgi:hypothetical protein